MNKFLFYTLSWVSVIVTTPFMLLWSLVTHPTSVVLYCMPGYWRTVKFRITTTWYDIEEQRMLFELQKAKEEIRVLTELQEKAKHITVLEA